jgi:hypothetical protein
MAGASNRSARIDAVVNVLKKKKAAAAEESEIVVEGDEVVEIPMEETDGEPADAPEAPAE